MISEANYISELKQKNEEAIKYVIDFYGPLLYRQVYKVLKSKEKSEECLNDVFFKIWIHIDLFDEEKGSFKNWIIKIANNLALDVLKRNNQYRTIYFENIEEEMFVNDSYQEQIFDESDLKKEEYKIVIENINKFSKIDR